MCTISRTYTSNLVNVHKWCSAQSVGTQTVQCAEDDVGGLCISGFSKASERERVQVRLDLGGQQWRVCRGTAVKAIKPREVGRGGHRRGALWVRELDQ